MLIFRNSYEGMHAVVQFLAERGIPFDIEKRSQNSNYIYDTKVSQVKIHKRDLT